MRRWLGVDVADLPVDRVGELVAEALEMRRLEVDAMAEAIAVAFGGTKQRG